VSELLSVDGLRVNVAGSDQALLGPLEFSLAAGECLGLIGESGSGKSLTALSLIGLLPSGLQVRGELRWQDRSHDLQSSEIRHLRGRHLAWLPQDPLAALHPLRRVGDQLIESLRALRGLSATAAHGEAISLFEQLELPEPAALLRRYPHQLSGGQRQRVSLALALSGEPSLLIADEPTSALDSRLAKEMLELLDRLRRQRGLALLLISHDLPLVGAYAQRVLILQKGQAIESGMTAAVFTAPKHDYTRALLAADHLPVAVESAAGGSLLEVRDLHVRYPRAPRDAVAAASFDLRRGECLAVVGESGSGKTSLGRALLRLLRRGVSGRISLDGTDLQTATRDELRMLRRRAGIVFQDPQASLDPRQRVADIVTEPLRIEGEPDSGRRRQRALALLAQVGLDASMLVRFPHQLSGGQRQRVAIARALASHPELLICDEALSALDAQHRAGILALLATLKREHGLALLFITHDLNAAAALADRIAVMYEGRIIEQGNTATVLTHPEQRYTRLLLAARPAGATIRVQATTPLPGIV
jgi:ABC-type glutathione transport system ATPase component